jgi:pyrroloquinoline quinone (PQQ) biosynthesis protein C
MAVLRRTVPFVARNAAGDDCLLVDRVELPLGSVTSPEVAEALSRPLSLGAADRCVPAAEAERLVEAQYEACLEFVYSHPAWEHIRSGSGTAALSAYLLESRHYLAAAPFRMASGITDSLRPSELVRLQAHHVVEEADHDQYFENGLAALGCDRDLVRGARPSPVTTEWIHLMRTVAAYSPLAAAICSGLLEYTAGDTASVSGWHEMLVERGLLPAEAVRAVYEHVEIDLGLGHGANWRDALTAAGVVPAEDLADWLNAVTLVAEMIVRWLDSFEPGLSHEVVAALPGLRVTPGATQRYLAGEVDGLPVWPAEVYDSYAHGPRDDRPGVRRSLALAYAFAGRAADRVPPDEVGPTPATAAADLTGQLARGWTGAAGAGDLRQLVEGWMTAIDGHALWAELRDRPTYPLVYGWMAENHHYVAGIWQHAGAAVGACPDPVIRAELVRHLIEEFNHGRMFRRGIDRGRADSHVGPAVAASRPLPTTVGFVGTLRTIAQRDWKAYLLGLAFLQLSLSVDDKRVADRHEEFYLQMFRQLPESRALVAAMRLHDAEDTGLGHGEDTLELLRLLADRHELGAESVSIAALIPQLAWSFLDGVLQHYRRGDAAVLQRLGWHVR